jgi:hypothetical protein
MENEMKERRTANGRNCNKSAYGGKSNGTESESGRFSS